MTSSISWLDADDEYRRQMREALELLRQEGAVDELRLGPIRDAISDKLFPGTSVLWTRARYLLFVPWMFQALETGLPGRARNSNPEDQIRKIRIQLARELSSWAQGQEDSVAKGIIGRRGGDVVQTPEMNTWNSLKVWGILTQEVTRDQAIQTSVGAKSGLFPDGDSSSPVPSIWSTRLPCAPAEFPKGISLNLEKIEAEFLSSQLGQAGLASDLHADRRQESLLPVLLSASEAEFAGATTVLSQVFPDLSDRLHQALDMAWCFAKSMRAAQLLYVQTVCQTRGDEQAEKVLGELETEWTQWRDEVDFNRITRWHKNFGSFLAMFSRDDGISSQGDFNFVKEWTAQLLQERDGVSASSSAEELIIKRERRVKGSKARVLPSGKVGLDQGVNVPAELTFRWDVAHGVIADIREGLRS